MLNSKLWNKNKKYYGKKKQKNKKYIYTYNCEHI